MKGQSKKGSLIEQLLNVGSGFLISSIVWAVVICPVFNIPYRFSENLEITLIFTVVSVARGYFWRRLFNRYASNQEAHAELVLTVDQAVLADVFSELRRAYAKFPEWPTDPLHALAVLGEEFGELTKDTLQLCYEPHKTTRENLRAEAVQTIAMALRFASSLDRYTFAKGEQHSRKYG